jgi:hypothetical protein
MGGGGGKILTYLDENGDEGRTTLIALQRNEIIIKKF